MTAKTKSEYDKMMIKVAGSREWRIKKLQMIGKSVGGCGFLRRRASRACDRANNNILLYPRGSFTSTLAILFSKKKKTVRIVLFVFLDGNIFV